jgi:hypothetical protein
MLVVALLSLGDFEDHCQIVRGERVSVCYLWYDSISRALVDLDSRLGNRPCSDVQLRGLRPPGLSLLSAVSSVILSSSSHTRIPLDKFVHAVHHAVRLQLRIVIGCPPSPLQRFLEPFSPNSTTTEPLPEPFTRTSVSLPCPSVEKLAQNQ